MPGPFSTPQLLSALLFWIGPVSAVACFAIFAWLAVGKVRAANFSPIGRTLLFVLFVVASLIAGAEAIRPEGAPIWDHLQKPKVLAQLVLILLSAPGAVRAISSIFDSSVSKEDVRKVEVKVNKNGEAISGLDQLARQQFNEISNKLDRIASDEQLDRRLVEKIAIEVLKRNSSFTHDELLTAVREQAKTARQLRDENEQLRTRIADLEKLAIHDLALAALDRAKAAINDGRFGDAEREYETLRRLGWGQISDGWTAWETAVDGQVKAAILAGENDRAAAIRRAAADEMRADADRANRNAREQYEKLADERYQEGLVFGRSAALAESIAVYRQDILPRFSKTAMPADWARIQNNLGTVLQTQGQRTGGPQGLELLAQAVQAYRAALSVRTQDETPIDWAGTQNNLGNVLSTQGERTGGPQGLELLAQAVQAYRAALSVYTQNETPIDWAMTQNNLGNVLSTQGERTGGPQGLELLAQAVEAYRAALNVYTQAKMTPFIEKTQRNLDQVNALIQERQHGGSAPPDNGSVP